jgi:hypothetical protein
LLVGVGVGVGVGKEIGVGQKRNNILNNLNNQHGHYDQGDSYKYLR